MARDKAWHLLAGFLVAAFGLWIVVTAHFAGIKPEAAIVLACGITFAITKEAADWLDNEAAARAGLPPPHGVEFGDALWGSFASVLVAGVIQWH